MFNKKHNKLTALILTASMLLMSGCAPEAEPQTSQSAQPNNTEQTEAAPMAEGGVWKGEGGCYKLTDPGLEDSANGIFVYDGKIFTTTWEFIDNNSSMDVLCGGEVYYHATDIREIAVGEAGIWVLEDVTDYSSGRASREFSLAQIGFDKQEKLRQDVTKYIEDYFPYDMTVDAQGQVMLMLENSVIAFGPDGVCQGSVSLQDEPLRLAVGGDGKTYAVTGVGKISENALASSARSAAKNINQVLSLDFESGEAKVLAEYEGLQISGGGGDYQFIAINNDGLYGIFDVEGELEPIAVWSELGISLNGQVKAYWMDDGRFLVEDEASVGILTQADPSEIKPKTIITMACFLPWNGFTSLAAGFNLNNDKYTLQIVDYSQNGLLTVDEAITKLNTDILSGNVPDLFDFSYVPYDNYTAKGLTEDLYTWIDQDPDVSKEDFIQLEKLELDGKLYSIPQSYYMESGVGLKSRFGDRFGWSLEEYLEIQSQNKGEIMYNVTKEHFLNTMAYRYAGDAIDRAAGICHFDSEEFIGMLEAIAKLRENPESENPADMDFTPAGRRLREGTLIVCSWYLDNVQGMANARAETGEPVSFVGWPTPDGSCGTTLSANNLAAICTKGNKEGAWEFVKHVITGGSGKADNIYGIPVNRSILEKQITGFLNSPGDENNAPVTQEDVDLFYKLLDRSVYHKPASTEVVNIILEEAAPFLAGEKSAKETAALIQSRVKLLIAE